jgi:hypothetical protein
MELPFEPRANVGPRQPELPFGESVRGQSRAVAEPVAPDYTRQMRLPFDGPEPKQLALSFRGKPNPIGEKGPFYVNQTGQVTTGRGITRLGRPGFLEFEGLEVRAARDLSHLSESTLRAMSELGFAAKDPVSGDPLVLHHLNQQPAGPLVEIPASKHSVWNTRQHPLGNTKGSGLTPEQRAVFNPWRNEYWKARAIEELKLRGLL